MLYVNGCATGNVELTKKAFHENAIMYGYLNGELCAGSIDALYGAISQLGADEKTKAEVDVIEVVGTAATSVWCWKTGTACRSPISIPS